MEQERKLAVLIDAENIAGKYVTVILNEANSLGNVIYKRIYGNWTNPQMSAWRNVILDNCIQPIQQYSNVSGKNSSDSSLIIDAMDLLYSASLDGFCIVSSDSDFTRLAARLRESGKYVVGMGEQKTPRSFISACNKFSYLDLLYAADGSEDAPEKPAEAEKAEPEKAKPAAKPAPAGQQKPAQQPARAEEKPAPVPAAAESTGSDLKHVRQAIVSLAEENSDDDGWIFSSTLKNLLDRMYPDFDVRNFGYKKFVPFINSLDVFDVEKMPAPGNGTIQLVYFKLRPRKQSGGRSGKRG